MDIYDDQSTIFDLEAQMRPLREFNDGAYDLSRWSVPADLFAAFELQEGSDA